MSGSVPESSSGPRRLAAYAMAALARHGERPALAVHGTWLSYADVAGRIRAYAKEINDLAMPEHSLVGVNLKTTGDYVIAYYGLLCAGHLPFLIDVNFQRGELDAIHEGCGLSHILIDRGRSETFPLPRRRTVSLTMTPHALLELAVGGNHAAPLPSTGTCRFTTGTTGCPKCIEFASEVVIAAAENWVEGTGLDSDDCILCAAALSNGLAFNTSLLATLISGARLCFASSPPTPSRVAAALAADRITRLVAFPAIYQSLVAATDIDQSGLLELRHAISAGARLPQEIRDRFTARWGVPISDYYGVAETGPITFEPTNEVNSGLGRPLPGCALRIDAGKDNGIGEVLVHTTSMASRYLNFPGLFEQRLTADGFYRTGDLGLIDDGRLFLNGRIGSGLNLAGRNIDPEEILGVVMRSPGVTDACLMEDVDDLGNPVLHLVVAPPGRVKRSEIVSMLRAELAPYKTPGRITFVDDIPRSGIGKPVLSAVRAAVARQ